MKCEKFTDDGRQVMAIVHLDQSPGELKTIKAIPLRYIQVLSMVNSFVSSKNLKNINNIF
jgi:hypothetical protein